ncbi:MAG: hypothetical protein A2277_02680 [Desulfobacterales bacterium RIFOXYA12_FULL_46_15]|nr:MAG: hypothetical protein A2097_05590 [Desulfobacula sp. GWF2_41_7]OGR22314.1 MAG: hypothetical protein A2277_02680 [Desulfobacterales bacterium RIFOXYA12_FULL_46_15]
MGGNTLKALQQGGRKKNGLTSSTMQDRVKKNEMNICYEEPDSAGVQRLVPIADTRQFGPPTNPDDSRFGKPTNDSIPEAIYIIESGLINVPKQSVYNAPVDSDNIGGKYLFNANVAQILKKNGQCSEIKLIEEEFNI